MIDAGDHELLFKQMRYGVMLLQGHSLDVRLWVVVLLLAERCEMVDTSDILGYFATHGRILQEGPQ